MGEQGDKVDVDADVNADVETGEAQPQASGSAPAAAAPAPPARPASQRSYSHLARAAMFNNVTASGYASASTSATSSSTSAQTPTPTTPPGFHVVVDMASVLQQRGNANQNDPSNQSSSINGKPLMPGPAKTVVGRALGQSPPTTSHHLQQHPHGGVGRALTDTPVPTAPPSPQIQPKSPSGSSTPATKPRATTLDIPGLTKSKVSPDGRIAQRDVGSKLVIVMVGLPARGKSYITKKLARYLNWMQHDCKIFNVGQRRRTMYADQEQQNQLEQQHHQQGSSAAGGIQTESTDGPKGKEKDNAASTSLESELRHSVREMAESSGGTTKLEDQHDVLPPPSLPSAILVNGEVPEPSPDLERNPSPMTDLPTRVASPPKPADTPGQSEQEPADQAKEDRSKSIDQPASFFDPHNREALAFREQIALATLDELLNYILDEGGSVGILDATNSTLERRIALINHIRERAGPELNVMFVESQCFDDNLLQANMRLKLSGPDYRDKDPKLALDDFKNRMALYEESYVPLGEYEETHDIPFLKVIDVSRKLVTHQVNGFLSSQVVYYLLNFNLSPRQIWITRHGESLDDVQGKIGGDANLSEDGIRYAKALTRFMDAQRTQWADYQRRKSESVHFPPKPGDSTPPNPQYASQTSIIPNFCVWTAMMRRDQETVQFFDEEEYDVKEMRMLDEMNVGRMDGMTHAEVMAKFPEDYERRKKSKLHYRYPGTGGEGYLDLINRLKAVIVEIERMTDHVLIVSHRSVARVLLAYFLGLKRENLTDLEIPLGVVYCLEPKTYGVEFKMYRYDPEKDDFFVWGNENFERAAYR